jgi:hypothetical protein
MTPDSRIPMHLGREMNLSVRLKNALRIFIHPLRGPATAKQINSLFSARYELRAVTYQKARQMTAGAPVGSEGS